MTKTASVLACVVLAATAASAVAQPADTDLSIYVAATAPGPLEKLVLCDTTTFLASEPDLDADVIIVRRDGVPDQRLLPPDFVTNGFLYRQGYDRLFERLRRQKLATREQLAQIQGSLGRGLIDRYRRRGVLPPTFVSEQFAFCNSFARSYGIIPTW